MINYVRNSNQFGDFILETTVEVERTIESYGSRVKYSSITGSITNSSGSMSLRKDLTYGWIPIKNSSILDFNLNDDLKSELDIMVTPHKIYLIDLVDALVPNKLSNKDLVSKLLEDLRKDPKHGLGYIVDIHRSGLEQLVLVQDIGFMALGMCQKRNK